MTQILCQWHCVEKIYFTRSFSAIPISLAISRLQKTLGLEGGRKGLRGAEHKGLWT